MLFRLQVSGIIKKEAGIGASGAVLDVQRARLDTC
jgi:hypothetical protein